MCNFYDTFKRKMIRTSCFFQKVRIVFRRSCFYKKERQAWHSFFRAPAKIAKRVLRDNFRAPAKILHRQKICGKRRLRRKRKQLEQTQAVSKCALRRRGGAKGVPPKPLKGSPTSASLVRCQRHRASELRAPPHFGLTPSCAAASECFCKQASRCRGGRANRQPTSSFCYFRLFRRLWFASPLHHEKRHPVNGAFSRGGAKGIRTPDLLNAIQTRYQLRYNPIGNPIIQETA